MNHIHLSHCVCDEMNVRAIISVKMLRLCRDLLTPGFQRIRASTAQRKSVTDARLCLLGRCGVRTSPQPPDLNTHIKSSGDEILMFTSDKMAPNQESDRLHSATSCAVIHNE